MLMVNNNNHKNNNPNNNSANNYPFFLRNAHANRAMIEQLLQTIVCESLCIHPKKYACITAIIFPCRML